MNKKMMSGLCAAMICAGATLQAGAIDRMITSWWYGEKAKPPMIAVLVVHDQPGVVLEVKGKYKLYDPYTNNFISTRFIGKRKFVQAMADSLKWGEEFPGIHQIKIVPDDEKTTTIVDGVEYKGNVIVYDIGGTISVVNEVPLEDYLKALLVPQFEQKLSFEAAAAVAIAARTNAWYQSLHGNQYWSVEANKVGYEGNAAAYSNNNGIEQAILETRDMVMVKDNEPFPAEWGSGTGGSSGTSKPVFSRITLFEAEELAKKGNHAAQILEAAFPGVSITRIEK